jgi:hypothetical protein
MQTLIFSVGLSIFYGVAAIKGMIPWWFAVTQAFLAVAAFNLIQVIK